MSTRYHTDSVLSFFFTLSRVPPVAYPCFIFPDMPTKLMSYEDPMRSLALLLVAHLDDSLSFVMVYLNSQNGSIYSMFRIGLY